MANKIVRVVETKTRVVDTINLTEEMKASFTEENGCYLSSNKKQILFTDMEFFDLMNKKFELSKGGRNGKRIQPYTIEHWVKKLYYRHRAVHYFNLYINLKDFAESVEEMAEIWHEDGVICIDGWDEILKDYVKLSVIAELSTKLDYQSLYEMGSKEIDYTLQKMKDEGYDSNLLKNEIDLILSGQVKQ